MADGGGGGGGYVALIGALMGAVGGYYDAKSQRYQLASQASALDFQADISRQNARIAEMEANDIMRAGELEAGRSGMAYGQARGALRTSIGASGVLGGVGSAAEIGASLDLAKELDAMQINSNRVRGAVGARLQRQSLLTEAAISGANAQSARYARDSIHTGRAVTTSLLGAATGVSSSWYGNRRQ